VTKSRNGNWFIEEGRKTGNLQVVAGLGRFEGMAASEEAFRKFEKQKAYWTANSPAAKGAAAR
jgi:hypothetical protein